jgi:hypothetical protein
VATASHDLRGGWEAELLALAFCTALEGPGLTKVAWFAFSRGGRTLEYAHPAVAPLSPT